MPALNWGMISDGGTFESLMHSILYAEDPNTILFGRPGKDAGQDARSADGSTIFQAKYRQQLNMDAAVPLALAELESIKKYRQPTHANYEHWRNARTWTLVANLLVNPNDASTWITEVVPAFLREGLAANYWTIETLEGKLLQHAPIREVFFEGENRVLVSLKEAHDYLQPGFIGGDSLQTPLIGRESELGTVTKFVAEANKRILPVVGPPGIGKSRLIYEAMVLLGQQGWRVLWALPESMARSSNWFRLLNNNQPTCVAIDDPSDSDLLRAVIEQLAPVERRNWKIIVGCRSAHAEMLLRFKSHSILAQKITLPPLDANQSKELLTVNGVSFQPAHYHTVYQHTAGIPGWLILVAELSKRQTLNTFPASADDIASAYIADCLSRIGAENQDDSLRILRHLALWNTVSLDFDSDIQSDFVATLGLTNTRFRELLKGFVASGLVQNWGVNKRLFAIQPLIIREHLLSAWLFDFDGEAYQINSEGKRIINLIIKGNFPAVEAALRSLSHLARSRLEPSRGFSFLRPVFEELMRVAHEGNVIEQSRLLPLLKPLGASDPESVLDVARVIRESTKPSIEVADHLWGKVTFTHLDVLRKVPWLLFEIAGFVYDPAVATRYLQEFRQLSESPALSQAEDVEPGKNPRKLLQRILCESRNSFIFSEPAQKIAQSEIAQPASWPFVGTLLECLMHPLREYSEWTARWTLTVRRRAFSPNSPEWNTAAALREQVYAALRSSSTDVGLRPALWRTLAESHHEYHRLLLNSQWDEVTSQSYRSFLLNDLTKCTEVLGARSGDISISEAVAARAMWSWYLEYSDDNDMIALARRCEQACDTLSRWRLQDYFRFERDEVLAPETERVANVLRSAQDTAPFTEFFDAVKSYLDAARSGGVDMADSSRITTLADRLLDLFSPEISPEGTQTPLTAYVLDLLKSAPVKNEFAWWFAVRICQQYLIRVKTSDVTHVLPVLEMLSSHCGDKGRFLFDLYSNPHPRNTGALLKEEFVFLMSQEKEFQRHQLFVFLGGFAPLIWPEVKPALQRILQTLKGTSEVDRCVGVFIQMLQLSALRYEVRDLAPQLDWILETIIAEGIDGAILGSHALSWLKKQTNFRLTLPQLNRLIRSRIALEEKPRVSDSFRLLPFEFDATEWCRVDETDPDQQAAFDEFCTLGLTDGFIGYHMMPKLIQQLNPRGNLVASFVQRHLQRASSVSAKELIRVAYLASGYSDESDPWASIATPICRRAAEFTREDRERVFFGLSRKETGVLTSSPGEVPSYYVQTRDAALRMRNCEPDGSPLVDYRSWALRTAESDLKRAREAAEEDND